MQKLTLRQWMAVRDMKVLDFAEAVGVSYPTVTSWRKGRTRPNTKYIPKIEETLGVSFQDITWT